MRASKWDDALACFAPELDRPQGREPMAREAGSLVLCVHIYTFYLGLMIMIPLNQKTSVSL